MKGDYGGSKVLAEMGWNFDTSATAGVRQTHLVAQKLPAQWGLHDMHLACESGCRVGRDQ